MTLTARHLAMAAIGVVAVLLVVGALAWSHRVSPQEREDSFIRELDGSGITYPSRDGAIVIGRGVCDIITAEGSARGNVASLSRWYSQADAEAITKFAVWNFCPEYSDLVGG